MSSLSSNFQYRIENRLFISDLIDMMHFYNTIKLIHHLAQYILFELLAKFTI